MVALLSGVLDTMYCVSKGLHLMTLISWHQEFNGGEGWLEDGGEEGLFTKNLKVHTFI